MGRVEDRISKNMVYSNSHISNHASRIVTPEKIEGLGTKRTHIRFFENLETKS